MSTNQVSFTKINNKERVGAVLCVGTPFENEITQEGLKPHLRKLEKIFIRTNEYSNAPRDPGDIKQEIANAVAGKKNPVVFSDTGYSRPHYDIFSLANDVKEVAPGTAVALLTSEPACVRTHEELVDYFRQSKPDLSFLKNLDYVFHYGGNDDVYATLVALHQDHLNYRLDKERVILVVEDMADYYTDFLISLQKINHGRTHVLLARDFEAAEKLVRETRGRLAGAILDMRFPRNGSLVDLACLDVVRLILESDARVPIVLQSQDDSLLAVARQNKRVFTLDKKDNAIYHNLREIIRDHFGFGPFIFRHTDGSEMTRVESIKGLYSFVMGAAPGSSEAASVLYHASNDHFSNWLWLHNGKGAAKIVKPFRPSTIEDMQKLLAEACAAYL